MKSIFHLQICCLNELPQNFTVKWAPGVRSLQTFRFQWTASTHVLPSFINHFQSTELCFFRNQIDKCELIKKFDKQNCEVLIENSFKREFLWFIHDRLHLFPIPLAFFSYYICYEFQLHLKGTKVEYTKYTCRKLACNYVLS